MSADERILVFAKPPEPGAVKTRLIPRLSAEAAAQFHLAALADTLAVAHKATAGRVELCVAGGAAAVQVFRRLYPDLTIRCQQGEDLGARLANAFAESFALGSERTLIVGSDHPTLPPELLAAGLARARTADVAFGPSHDGGYYAIAVRRERWPTAQAVLRDVPWSTPRALETSLARAREAGLEAALVPAWYDVDSPEDLERLRHDADPNSASARFLRESEERGFGGGTRQPGTAPPATGASE